MFLGFGGIWIRQRGKIDKEARFVIANHQSLCDIYTVFLLRDISCVLRKRWAHNTFLKHILEIVNPVYVEAGQGSRTKEIIDRADDSSQFPVLLFPEEVRTNGEVLLQFHRNAFLTPYKVQPMLIRYWLPFVPKGWNTIACVNQSFLSFLWQLISLPAVIIEVDALQSISMEAEGKADIDTFTRNAQIILANRLKIRAISRTSEEIKAMTNKANKKYN
jgi:hypothetical protein